MKDLTFIHLGNQTQDDGLVKEKNYSFRLLIDLFFKINFEKLRMIAKEIRYIISMSSSPYVKKEFSFD
jgi:hypothetical protein